MRWMCGADGSEIGGLGLGHDLNLALVESVSGSATEADVFVPSGVVDAQGVGMCLPAGDDGVNFPNAVEQVALSVVLDSHVLSFLVIHKNNTSFPNGGWRGAAGAARKPRRRPYSVSRRRAGCSRTRSSTSAWRSSWTPRSWDTSPCTS